MEFAELFNYSVKHQQNGHRPQSLKHESRYYVDTMPEEYESGSSITSNRPPPTNVFFTFGEFSYLYVVACQDKKLNSQD